jgi:hypothetical protein
VKPRIHKDDCIKKSRKQKLEWWLLRAEERGKWGAVSWVQSFSLQEEKLIEICYSAM